ncbi:MAG: DNA recombination protein RmuC [Akkermansiaceae bacterium]|nr:DNA recombination protein RmuC [Akkermansiaceae bacterium]
MSQFIQQYQAEIITAAIAVLLGWLITWLIANAKLAAAAERFKAEERRATGIEARLAQATATAENNEQEAQTFRNQLTEIRSRLEAETKASAEKQALLERAEVKLADTFKALSSDALKASSEQFLHLAKSTLSAHTEEARGDIDKRRTAIENLVKPMAESLGQFQARLGEIEKHRTDAYAELRTQIRSLGEGQLGLQRETAALVKALRQPSGRGQWGELQLRRVVELAGMQEYCDFETQPSTTTDEGRNLRPDLIVKLPGGKTIVVDSKTPMDAYLDAIEATDDTVREEALHRHARQVRTHIQQLSSKNYTSQFASAPEFTVLFLPSESFFSAALQSDPGLIERGVDQGVILATPTTLIALLRAVAYGWRQESIAENAREISALGRTLHERLGKLTEHFARLGRSLGSAVDSYNNAVGTFETRVLTAARKVGDLKATAETTSLPDLEPIDKIPRSLQQAATPAARPAPLAISAAELLDPPPATDDADAAADYTFVPIAQQGAQGAAADLRAALEDFGREPGE